MAPEVVEDVEANINMMCDVFSYGMVLYERTKLKFSLPFHPVPMCSHFLVQLSALLAPNGSLFDYLHQRKDVPSPDQSLAWAQQIASGMQHLHNNNVVHHDLKY